MGSTAGASWRSGARCRGENRRTFVGRVGCGVGATISASVSACVTNDGDAVARAQRPPSPREMLGRAPHAARSLAREVRRPRRMPLARVKVAEPRGSAAMTEGRAARTRGARRAEGAAVSGLSRGGPLPRAWRGGSGASGRGMSLLHRAVSFFMRVVRGDSRHLVGVDKLGNKYYAQELKAGDGTCAGRAARLFVAAALTPSVLLLTAQSPQRSRIGGW
eukprot:scaffold1279_cov306-Prasinococcus_capsulatus_cf.AAC.7